MDLLNYSFFNFKNFLPTVNLFIQLICTFKLPNQFLTEFFIFNYFKKSVLNIFQK